MSETLPANAAIPQLAANPTDLATIVVAAEGDLRLAAEMLGPTYTPATITRDLLSNGAAQSSLAANLKTMLLLSLVQLMGEVKQQVLSTLPDFSPRESLEALRLITEGISSLIPPPTQSQTLEQGNTNNYIMGDDVASKLINRLSQYRPPALADPAASEADLESVIRNG